MPTIAEIAKAIDPEAFAEKSPEIMRAYGDWILERQERAREAAERVADLYRRAWHNTPKRNG
jgi:hypothetical protein